MASARLLIRGAGFQNKGAEAMIRCVTQGVIERIETAEGLLRTHDADLTAQENLQGLTPWRFPGRRGLVALSAAYRLGLLRPGSSGRLAATLASHGTDWHITGVVDISGYAWGDPWETSVERTTPPGALGRMRAHLRKMLVSDADVLSRLGVPVVFMPQAWGPFTNPASVAAVKRALRSAVRVYARDTVSLEWLSSLPELPAETFRLASDIAFTFRGESAEVGRALLSRLGVRFDGTPLAGIVPNMRVYERATGAGPQNAYIRGLAAAADRLTTRCGCQVVLLPHEIRRNGAPDDRVLCEMVRAITTNPSSVYAATEIYRAEQLKAMIGCMELLVSSRFHSIIGALSLRVPVVCCGWSHKYDELMSGVGLSEYTVGCDATDLERLPELCVQAWERRRQLREALEQRVPPHEASARRVLDEAVSLLRPDGPGKRD